MSGILDAILEPITNGGLFMELLWLVAIYMMLASSLDLVLGYAGMFHLGHVGFVALGAISTAMGTHPDFLGLDLFGGLLLGALAVTAAVLLIGLPTLRLTGDYFAIATLGFGIVAQAILIGFWTRGIFGAPTLNPFGCDLDCMTAHPVGAAIGDTVVMALTGGTARSAKGLELVLVWAIAIAVVALLGRIKHAPFGRVLRSIREDRAAAAALGKNVPLVRFQAFWLSALVAGLCGGLTVHHQRLMNPFAYDFQFTVLMLVFVILGGMGSHVGAVIGAIMVTAVDQFSRSLTKWMDQQPWSGDADMPSLRVMLFGLLLLLFMLLRPTGIMGGRDPRFRDLLRKEAWR